MLHWWPITHSITMTPNQITSLDAAMTILFHIECQRRGASEFLRWPRTRTQTYV